ncbi:hypothetical protein HDV00_002789 [Rhizophlyctis rosea]|nr:hypothetical protein HDV00_002789 [Rhizophlyctis rosea]
MTFTFTVQVVAPQQYLKSMTISTVFLPNLNGTSFVHTDLTNSTNTSPTNTTNLARRDLSLSLDPSISLTFPLKDIKVIDTDYLKFKLTAAPTISARIDAMFQLSWSADGDATPSYGYYVVQSGSAEMKFGATLEIFATNIEIMVPALTLLPKVPIEGVRIPYLDVGLFVGIETQTVLKLEMKAKITCGSTFTYTFADIIATGGTLPLAIPALPSKGFTMDNTEPLTFTPTPGNGEISVQQKVKLSLSAEVGVKVPFAKEAGVAIGAQMDLKPYIGVAASMPNCTCGFLVNEFIGVDLDLKVNDESRYSVAGKKWEEKSKEA